MFSFNYEELDATYSRVKWEFLFESRNRAIQLSRGGYGGLSEDEQRETGSAVEYYFETLGSFFPGIEDPGWVEKKIQEEPVSVPRLDDYIFSFLDDFQKSYPKLFLETWKRITKKMWQPATETSSFEEDLEGWVYRPQLGQSSRYDWFYMDGPIEAIQILCYDLYLYPEGWDLVVKHFPEAHEWVERALEKINVAKCHEILDGWIESHPQFGEYSIRNSKLPLCVGISVSGGQLPYDAYVSLPKTPQELEGFLQDQVFAAITAAVEKNLRHYAEKARKKAEAEKLREEYEQKLKAAHAEYEQYLRQKMAKAIAFVENLGGSVVYDNGFLKVKIQGRTWDFREFLRKRQYKGVLPKVNPMPLIY